MATTSAKPATAIPRRRRPAPGGFVRAGLTFALALGLGLTGLGCTSFNKSVSNSGGALSWLSSNPYDEPSGVGAWWSKPAPDSPATPEAAAQRTAMDDKARGDLEVAKRQYLDKNYAEAENAFNLIAKAKKMPIDVQEDALFYRGECQRLQANYRQAEGSLKLYIKSFPYGKYTSQANDRLFDIANYWLNPTREKMKLAEEQREGKASRWSIMPVSWINFTNDMPWNDVEGHALGVLEEVRLNDIKGKLAEKSLFYIATVKFYNEDYKEADYYYSQIVDHHPQSELAAKAMKQSIICKQIANGGTQYDTRLVEKCRAYLEEFQRSYPGKDVDWIHKQLVSITHQQADRDFNIGEFYRRTGHPGPAYFYYEIVRRTYPNTEYARKAEARMNDLRSRVSEEQRTASADPKTPQPWYQELVNSVTPTRSVLDTSDVAAPVAQPPAAPPGLLPQNLDRK
jgi:outer membrane protein assembly factor BamD (BamD/ComL family)